MKKLLQKLYLPLALLPLTAFGQTGVGTNPPITLPNPLKTNATLLQLIENIANFLLYASILLGTIMIIYAGFLIITSGGAEGKVEQGKKIILYTVIGLGVMMLFKVIIALVGQIVGVQVNP